MLDFADWNYSVPDWEDRIKTGQSLVPNLPLNTEVADRAEEVFGNLRVPDLPGTPRRVEVTEDWVFDLVRAIFGAYDPATRARAFQDIFFLVPKKNTKSDLAAAIILTAIILNDRPLIEAILVAPSQKISKISFNQIKNMIALEPELTAILHVQTHNKTITHLTTEATIEVVSADGTVATGTKAAFILVDETHEFSRNARAKEIVVELRGGLASRPEGFFMQITTQSKKEPEGLFKAELQAARAVRDGTSKARKLVVIYEMPRDMQKSEAWRDEANWGLVNPNLGVSVQLDFLRERFAAALEDGPDALALFASQHLNVEVGLGLHSQRWVAADYWPSRETLGLDFDRLIARSDVAVVGGDMGGADDLGSLFVMGRDRETRNWLGWARAWCFPDVLKRRKQIAPKLLDLQETGDLIIEPSSETHVQQMADVCSTLLDAGLFPETAAVGLDPHGVAALLDELLQRGFSQEMIVGVGQGYKLNGAIKSCERRLLDGTFEHGGQPLMTWCIGNAKAEAKGNNIYITKESAGVKKIDPVVAMFNAAILMANNPLPAALSYIETADVVVL